MKNFAVTDKLLSSKSKIKNLYQQYPLPFALLVIIAIATSVSGFLGFKLGDEALKGVSQPEVNPSQKVLDKPLKTQEKSDTSMVVFQTVDEKKVINQVKNYIASNGGKNSVTSNPKTKTKENKIQNKAKSTKTSVKSTTNKAETPKN